MKLEWKPCRTSGCPVAEGDKGTWRIFPDEDRRWQLTVVTPDAGGLHNRGKFCDLLQALGFAQEREDDVSGTGGAEQ